MRKRNASIITIIIAISGVCLLVGLLLARVSSLKRIEKSDRPLVVVTLYPQYDMVYQLLQDEVDLLLLLPPGIEAHAYEPTPWDMMTIRTADLLIYTNPIMEPWINKIEVDHLVNASEGITLMNTVNQNLSSDYALDPHVWMDPKLEIIMLNHIADALIQQFPNFKDMIQKNRSAYEYQIQQVDYAYQEFADHLTTTQKVIPFGGHFAFGYLANAYGFRFETPFQNFTPDAEPTVQILMKLIDTVRSLDHKVIYYEELASPKIAEIIASETDAQILQLHSIHNVSKVDQLTHKSYVDFMVENLNQLKEGVSE